MPLSTMNQYGVIRLTTNHKDENAKQTEKSLIPKKYTERSMVEDKQEARPEDFLSEEDIKRAELIQKRLARRAQRAPKSPNNPEPKEWLAKDWSRGKIADYKAYNFVDGEGVRCSIYVSGCLFACPGCYNRVVQNFNYGIDYTEALQNQILEDIGASYCQGLTLLGGEPMLNTNILLPLFQALRDRYGHSKDIWCWSGYTFEELLVDSEDKLALLDLIDVLVDGRFLQDQMDLTLQFRGSRNQRIIDVPASLQKNELVLWTNTDGLPYK